MDYLAIIVSIVALLGAGFAFLRAISSHNIQSKRYEALKEKSSAMEARLRKLEGNTGRGNKPATEPVESGRRNQPRQEQEGRQNQPRQEQQNEPRQKQPRQEQQQERRQKQRERQPQPQQQAAALSQPDEDVSQQPQQRRKKENRRRNEPMERANPEEAGREQQARAARPVRLEIQDGDLLNALEQEAGVAAPAAGAVAAAEAPYAGKKYAIIPEDGVIRAHQLQQQPDSDSYIEVDATADGSSTHYRFNLAGNHAFVIAQGIDRLENAFDFEKPSNRMVTKVVQQQDGVLTKVNNGWKIMEKARIDFR